MQLNQSDRSIQTVKELTLEARVEDLSKVLAFVDEYLETLDCPMKVQMQVDVAVEEIYVNVASYAYAPKTGPVTLRLEDAASPRSVTITFIDHGVPYNRLAKEDPDITLSAEERKIGGLGIYMVKKSMDKMSYEYTDQQNILRLTKLLD